MSKIDINTQSGERLTFYKLFKEKGYRIEIPIIQRDYAQGRSSTTEVREMFLDSLYSYLSEGLPNRDLDFVYGSLINNGTTNFIPLDGQQRLTTLFLLHWYLANISHNMPLLRDFLTLDGKSKFAYETRTSSSEFCDALMSHDIDITRLLDPDKGKQNSLSKTIRDFGWYYLSWRYDPTIQSMLTMLDSIHDKFWDNPEFFSKLIDEKNPIITFLFLNLKDFKLTDDLYIKMNSRGKPLTPFENFKAKIEQHISKLNPDTKRKFILKYGETGNAVTIRDYFSHKIDTDWANLFWNYRSLLNRSSDKNEIDNTFDDELMNFIRVIVSNQYALDCPDKDDKLEYLLGTQVARRRKDYSDVISYHKYISLGVLSDSSLYYLIDALDNLSNGENKITIHLPDTFYFDENKVFEKVLLHELTLLQRVLFFAYTRYLIENPGNVSGLSQWMRVIYNLAQNTVIDGADEVAKAIKSINNFLPFSIDILTFLREDSKIDFFTGRQVQEEKIKAHLLSKTTNDWKNKLEEIEKHSYFAGQIGFILEFSGILEYYEQNNNCDWELDLDNIHFNSFIEYSNKAGSIFNAIGNGLNKDFLWERAVLTKGDYLINTSASRRNFLNTDRNLRDLSWKRLLRLPPNGTNNQELQIWKNRRYFVKEVLDDNNFSITNLHKSLEKIIKDPVNDWRSYFINNPELIRYCEQGYIKFESANKIILYMQSQQNHRQREMYSYNLFLQNLTKIDEFLPFKKSWYYEVRGGDDDSCAILDEWCYARIHYSIMVYYDETDKVVFKDPFQIKFQKTKGNNKITDYPAEITDILATFNFQWLEDFPGFWITEKDETKTIALLKNLCKAFNDLIDE